MDISGGMGEMSGLTSDILVVRGSCANSKDSTFFAACIQGKICTA